MNKSLLLAGALLVGPPVMVLLPGCGGGNGGGLFAPATQTYTSNIALSSTQTAQLTLRVTGGTASGTLVVPQATTKAARSTKALAGTIAAGTYPLSGTVSGANFSLTGTFGGTLGAFSLTGQLPVSGGNGTYTLSANGQTATGTFGTPTTAPTATPTGTPTATATPTPTATATQGNGATINVSVQSSGGADFGTPAFNVAKASATGAGHDFTVAGTDSLGRTLSLMVVDQLAIGPYKAGQQIPLGGVTSFSVGVGKESWGGFGAGETGTVTVTQMIGTTLTLSLSDVQVPASPFSIAAKGTLTLNGTITATIPTS